MSPVSDRAGCVLVLGCYSEKPASGFSSQFFDGGPPTGVKSPSGLRVIRVRGVPRE